MPSHLHGAPVVVSGEAVEGGGSGVVGGGGGGRGLLLPRAFSPLPWIHHKHIVILVRTVTVLLQPNGHAALIHKWKNINTLTPLKTSSVCVCVCVCVLMN